MRVWAKTAEFSEGKFLVTRRDGTTPEWPHFVIGARDPAAPQALMAYADQAEAEGMDPEFCASVRDLAADFAEYRMEQGTGDPDAPPHRTDNPVVLEMMRHEFSVGDVITERGLLLEALSVIAGGDGDAQVIAQQTLKKIGAA
jgi:hypothetical protein